jgi:hypothetical protein
LQMAVTKEDAMETRQETDPFADDWAPPDYWPVSC